MYAPWKKSNSAAAAAAAATTAKVSQGERCLFLAPIAHDNALPETLHWPWPGATTPPPRDMEIEARITERHAADDAGQMNSYGGMGMDSISPRERALRVAELEYMTAHPELFPHKAMRRPRAEAWVRLEKQWRQQQQK